MKAVETREDLVDALREAATLEHGVVCSYLFAAFSLKTHVDEHGVSAAQLERIRMWKGMLLRIARQEMEHLGLVCNMLTAVGAMPHFAPPHAPLDRFGEAALQRFTRIEREHEMRPSEGSYSIGALYTKIRDGFEVVSRSNSLLFVGAPEMQVDNAAIDLPADWFDVHLTRVTDLGSACAAIDRVIEASHDAGNPHSSHGHRRSVDLVPPAGGERGGMDAWAEVARDNRHGERSERSSRPAGASHAAQFESVLEALHAERRRDPAFEPARPVGANPTLQLDPAGQVAGSRTQITHAAARGAAALFNAAYETMLTMLVRFYAPAGETMEARDGLRKLAFFPLMTMVLRPLGELLTQLPAAAEGGVRAAPTFECRHELVLPPHLPSARAVLRERVESMIKAAEALRLEDAFGAPGPRARLTFVQHNLIRIGVNFERYFDPAADRAQIFFRKLF